MKLIFFGILLVLVAGCASPPEQVLGREYLEKRAQAAANSKQCMDEVKNVSQVYQRLNDIFIYDLQDDRQLTKISNRSYVSEQNIADLIEFRDLIQPCYDQTLEDYGNADLRYADYILGVREKSDENLLALLNRQITIGERNIYLLEALLNNRQRFAEIDREVITDLNRAHYLKTLQRFDGQGYAEEHYSYPPLSLPGRQGGAPSELEPPETVFPGKQADSLRCRFEGSSIRCD